MRNFLIKLIAGNKPVVMNVTIKGTLHIDNAEENYLLDRVTIENKEGVVNG